MVENRPVLRFIFHDDEPSLFAIFQYSITDEEKLLAVHHKRFQFFTDRQRGFFLV